MQANGETPRPTVGETITRALGFVAVAGATIFVIWQLRPALLFSSNMDIGGDNAVAVVHNGVIDTVAGNGTQGYSGDQGTPTAAQLNATKGPWARSE